MNRPTTKIRRGDTAAGAHTSTGVTFKSTSLSDHRSSLPHTRVSHIADGSTPNPSGHCIPTTFDATKKTAREYRAQTPLSTILTHSPTVYATPLWRKLKLEDIRRRVDHISKRFTGAGWKNLPQELVDEIIGYLLDDRGALKACSLTCRSLFGATRPLIHQRLVCLGSRRVHPKPKGPLLSRRKGDPGFFERLIDADRSGVLRYTRHLAFRPDRVYSYPYFNPGDLQECLPHLRSIAELHSLTLDAFHVSSFIPVLDKHFGMFTNTLRHLDIRNAYGTTRELSYIICQFPLLEDLTIVSPAGERPGHPGHKVPVITQPPPLRGKLVLVQVLSRELSHGLTAFPGGLNFSSLELSWCEHLEPIFTACGHTATSISYLWGDIGGESNPPIQVYIAMQSWGQ